MKLISGLTMLLRYFDDLLLAIVDHQIFIVRRPRIPIGLPDPPAFGIHLRPIRVLIETFGRQVHGVLVTLLRRHTGPTIRMVSDILRNPTTLGSLTLILKFNPRHIESAR